MAVEVCVSMSSTFWYNKAMGFYGSHSEEAKERMRQSKLAERNPNWIGDKVGYIGLHNWIRRRLPKPEFCIDCGIRPAIDLANKGIYNRSLDNWEWLCRKCHMIKDGRMDKFHSRENYQKISKSLMGHKRFYKGDKRGEY